MTTIKQREDDLATLSPEEKVTLMLDIADNLRIRLDRLRDEHSLGNAMIQSLETAIISGRRWVSGDLVDWRRVIHPVYNADGTDVVDRYAQFSDVAQNEDAGALTDIITRAIVYAASQQFQREGGQGIPISYDRDLNDEDLAEILQMNRDELSTAAQAEFDELWASRFGT